MNDFIKAKEELEKAILFYIQTAISDFESEYKITPESINVHMDEITSVSDTRKRYKASGAYVNFGL